MKHVVTFLAVCIVAAASGHAAAADVSDKEYWYGKIGIGYAEQIDNYNEINEGQTEWDFDSAINLNVAAGYAVQYLALEGEFAYRTMDVQNSISKSNSARTRYSGDQSQTALLLNGYVMPVPEWKVSPYVGLGFGVTVVSWNDIRASGGSSLDDTDTVFTYQLIAGASYKITDFFILEADYRYVAPNDVEIDSEDGTVSRLDNQELHVIGLHIKFKI